MEKRKVEHTFSTMFSRASLSKKSFPVARLKFHATSTIGPYESLVVSEGTLPGSRNGVDLANR